MSNKKSQNTFEGVSTFIWWVRYPYDGEVKYLSPTDLGSYESDYVRCWNYVRDTGWERVDGIWLSPHNSSKYKTVYEAYNSQKFHEMQTKHVTTK